MKKLFLFGFLSLISFVVVKAQNVGIGTTTPHSSAMLDVSSTNKGLLIPRMTSVQRSAISTPANGLMVYDTDTKSVWYFNGSSWTNMAAAGSGGLNLPFEQSVNISGTAFRISNGALGNTAIHGESYFGTGIRGKSNEGIAISAENTLGTALKASSSSGFAIEASSVSADAVKAASANGNAVYGTTNAVSKAGVRGEATVDGANGIYGFNSASGVGVRGESNLGTGIIGYSTSGTAVSAGSISGTGIYTNSLSGLALHVNGNLRIAGGNTNPVNGAVLTSDASGNATWKTNRVAFRVSGVNSSFDGLPDNDFKRIQFAFEDYDYANNFTYLSPGTTPTTSSSTFTAPVKGLYHFDAHTEAGSNDISDMSWGWIRIMVDRNGTLLQMERLPGISDASTPSGMEYRISLDLQLFPGDKVYVEVLQRNDGEDNGVLTSGYTYFSGHLVFAD